MAPEEPSAKRARTAAAAAPWGAGSACATAAIAAGEVSIQASVVDAASGAPGATEGINTGICFLDHMIDQLTAHAQLRVSVRASLAGRPAAPRTNDFARPELDAEIVGGAGEALGLAIKQLLSAGPAMPSREFCFCAPLDEAFTELRLEFGGQPGAEVSLAPYGIYPKTGRKYIGSYRTALTHDFFQRLAASLGCRLSARKVRGDNAHHIVEATFKSFSRCLRKAMDAATGVSAATLAPLMPERPARVAEKKRATKETSIDVHVNLDPKESRGAEIATGIAALDAIFREIEAGSGIQLRVKCSGDMYIDEHHSAEDVAITMGKAISDALGDKGGCTRMGFAEGECGEARVRCVLDLSNRPSFTSDLRFGARDEERIGDISIEMVCHAFESLVMSALSTVHFEQLPHGSSDPSARDLATAAARALGAALGECASIDPRRAGVVSSSKGTLSK